MLGAGTSRHAIQKCAERMRDGDAKAADRLYSLLVKQTYGFYFSRLGDRAQAEDLTQNVFMKLIRSIGQYDSSKGDFVVWYWRMARTLLIDHYRTDKAARTHDIESVPEQEHLAAEDDLEEKIDADSRKSMLARCVSALQPDERELFELRFISELSYKEIADLSGNNEGLLRVRVNRIKKKLEKMLYAAN